MRFPMEISSLSCYKTYAAFLTLALTLALPTIVEASIVNEADPHLVAILARASTTSTATSSTTSTATFSTTSATASSTRSTTASSTTSSAPAATATVLLNKYCSRSSHCTTGVCDARGGDCFAPDGKPYRCDYYETPKRCRQAPLGHSCANTGDCAQGVCNKSTLTCTFANVGGNCARDTHCKSPAFCSADRKCVVPDNNTIDPQQPCAVSEQCRSGKCEGGQEPRNEYLTSIYNVQDDRPGGYLTYSTATYMGYESGRDRCAFFALGQSGCKNYTECQTGFCYNGKCAKGSAGDECLINDNCGSGTVCGLDGKCYLPPANNLLGTGQPTNNAETQCFSKQRKLSYRVQRPVPGRGGETHDTIDDVCIANGIDGMCRTNSDCDVSVCVNGICKKLFVHSRCDSDDQCFSGNCMLYTPDRTYKTCARVSTGSPCEQDDNCLSRYCRTVYEECDCNGFFTVCDGSVLGRECRTDFDCKGALTGAVKCKNRICTPTNATSPPPTPTGAPPRITTGLGSESMPFDHYASDDEIVQVLLA
ncbi:hypothetical protein CF327_g3969 [Tilletia walkeri]|nr:hypothetical protein CF327_g3969 [Tilletia walkeri]